MFYIETKSETKTKRIKLPFSNQFINQFLRFRNYFKSNCLDFIKIKIEIFKSVFEIIE